MTIKDEASLAQLMRNACGGDQNAYRIFLVSITPLLRGIVNAKASGLSPEDREEILQDVLIAVHTKKQSWRQDQALRPWLFAITRYKIIDRFRARGRAVFVDIDDFADQLSAPVTLDAETMDIEKLVSKLSGKQLLVVRAIGIEGKTHQEAASELGMNENAVRVNFHRGLEKLRAFGQGNLEVANENG